MVLEDIIIDALKSGQIVRLGIALSSFLSGLTFKRVAIKEVKKKEDVS